MTIANASKASWLEISSAALRNNIGELKKAMPAGQKIGVVLKGNAYGHGFLQVAKIIHGYVDFVFVISPTDALLLRQFEKDENLKPVRILVIGAIATDEVVACANEDIEVTIADKSWVEIVSQLKTLQLPNKVKAHLHVDTGLAREGFTLHGLTQLDFLDGAENVIALQGLFSHFANTEDVTEQNYAQHQLSAFEAAYGVAQKNFERLITNGLERHFAASASSLVLPESRFDILRIGISLYGLWPSTETRLSTKIVLGSLPKLTPALSWRCESQLVKTIAAGSLVGYGCTYRCESETKVAVFPIGYFDGYPRLLSGKAHVLVEGVRCPVIGRVMMNHIIVDISKVPGESKKVIATLIGHDGQSSISVEHIADWAQTIHYEIVARIGAHLRRVVVE